MPAINAGSITNTLLNGISPFPTAVSGIVTTIVNNQIFFLEQLTGQTIGTTSIAEQYQSPLTELSMANVFRLMAVQDMGVQSVMVGDLRVDNNNLFEMAKLSEERGMRQAKLLTKGIKFFRTFG